MGARITRALVEKRLVGLRQVQMAKLNEAAIILGRIAECEEWLKVLDEGDTVVKQSAINEFEERERERERAAAEVAEAENGKDGSGRSVGNGGTSAVRRRRAGNNVHLCKRKLQPLGEVGGDITDTSGSGNKHKLD